MSHSLKFKNGSTIEFRDTGVGTFKGTPCAWTPSGSLIRDMIHYRTCPNQQCQLRGTAIALMLRLFPHRCGCPNCTAMRTNVN